MFQVNSPKMLLLILLGLFVSSSLASPMKSIDQLIEEGEIQELIRKQLKESEFPLKEFSSNEFSLQNYDSSLKEFDGSITDGVIRSKHPDVGLNVLELIEKYGYPVERHQNIETEDGYILEMHRIPHGKNNPNIKNRPVVFLQHGILCSSADWVAMGPGQGLAYILADKGFDVWMGNFRGNTWSRKHKSYNPDKNKKKFWSFSWNEMGMYDLPAMIDYITGVTGQEDIFYVAHSQGTTAFFVMGSERPEYMKRIKLMTALAPIVFMGDSTNIFLRLLVKLEGVISSITNLMGMYEFLPNSYLFQQIGQTFCNDEAIFQPICTNILFMIAGYNSQQLDTATLPVILTNVPAGASSRQFFHYAQEIGSGDFKKYDFGWWTNLQQYGSLKPPKYDLSKVTAKVALFYADTDNLASEKDVNRLYNALPNVHYKRKIRDYNHLDFLWAVNAPNTTYNRVISLMERML